MRLLNGTPHQRSAATAKATSIRHKLAKRFQYGSHSMLQFDLQRLQMAFQKDPRNFETTWVCRKYACMPWRYFVALNWICERKLKRPLAYFRVEKPRLEAKERQQRARLMGSTEFDINNPNAIPPSDDWEWITTTHPGMGRGTIQYATCWVNTKK